MRASPTLIPLSPNLKNTQMLKNPTMNPTDSGYHSTADINHRIPPSSGPVGAHLTDSMQRLVLFWDVMRQRSEQYYAQKVKTEPTVLRFDATLVLDARHFQRPVNYLLFKVDAPADVVIHPQARPFVVVDPRAGHGPGIGGFKADSEVGVAMRAGHPCYFVGFTPHPVPGQTIEDIMHAQTQFLEKIISLHPQCDSKPCVVGNCQAGWAVMMAAAARPELFGPVIISGSPLSYWAGTEGKNPMRYTGGLSGGSWVTALTSDLGNGKFDGGHLVTNFENLNPANTLWGKHYDIWTHVDDGADRFLAFEKWWDNHVNLNGEEIQWIVDELFIGNKLATAEITLSDGKPIDLRNIRSPIICFCSKGDNITPPEQALGWIVDLYAHDADIVACGQTIVYAIHESVGHLGIFVSGDVARKEHQEFASNIDLIDILPPGLYEAVMTPKTSQSEHAELIDDDWITRLEPRTLADVRAIVSPSVENERRFATARRVSEVNLNLYRTLWQPWVRSMVNEQTVEMVKKTNLAEWPFAIFSDQNPLMQSVSKLAEQVRQQRQPVTQDNPLLHWQNTFSTAMVAALDKYRELRDKGSEQIFLATYSSPLLQAWAGVANTDEPPRKHPGLAPQRATFIEQHIAELKARITQGGLREAAIRSLIYVRLGGDGAVDERAFNELRLIRNEHSDLSLQAFKAILREQFFLLQIDPVAAIAAIPSMLPPHESERTMVMTSVRRVFESQGKLSAERAKRLAEIEKLFAVGLSKADAASQAKAKASGRQK